MRFLELRHVDGDQVVFAAVEQVRKRQRRLRLAHAAGTNQHENADRLVGVVERGARGLDALADDLHGVRLADDAPAQVLLQREHGGDFILEHFAGGNAGPGGEHLAHNLRIHADADQASLALQRSQLAFQGLQLRFQPQPRWLRLRPSAVAPFAACPALQLLAQFANLCYQLALLVPALLQRLELGGGSRLLLLNLGQLLLVVGAHDRLAVKDPFLHFEGVNLASGVFERRRGGVLSQRQASARGIEDAHCLVRQLASGEKPVRETDAGINRFVEYADVVVLFERSHQPAHHDEALVLAGLLHLDHLEAPGERRVLLEVLLVLGPCSRSDGAQFAAGERRLEQVGGVVLPRLAAGADHGVSLVDEENDGRGRGFHFFNQTFEPIFELSLDAGAGLQQRQVEGPHMHVLQRRRYVALGHAQREALDHGGLAHTRLAGEDGVVLPPPGKDVDDLANLRDHGPAPGRSFPCARCR